VGPTGAGKTLLLETIAGLHLPDHGEIWFEGQNITGLSPEKRNIGLVYQDCALFPHLSVADNITFGLKVRKEPTSEIRAKLAAMTKLVEVEHLLDRRPDKLSGGEKQKVALVRSLILKPRLLLLDEPLNALDPESRENLQYELKQVHRELGITIIHVTHDFEETFSSGTQVAVIGAGRINQVGTPDRIFRHPDSEFVARFTLMHNIFPGEVITTPEGKSTFKTGRLEFQVKSSDKKVCHASIRPDDIAVLKDRLSSNDPNILPGVVNRIIDKGPVFQVFLDLPPEFCCQITRKDFLSLNPKENEPAFISFSPDSVHLF